MLLASPTKDILYVTQTNLKYVSGQIRVKGRNNYSYRCRYLQMIDTIFGKKIEVCSGKIKKYAWC
jgi:hypothetical protein